MFIENINISSVKTEGIFTKLIIYLLKILPYNLFKKIIYKLNNNVLIIYIEKNNLKFLLNFFKNHYLLQFKTLITITAVDYPEKKQRFEVNYFLLSYLLNLRINIKILVNDITPVESINSIYSSSL
jgi:NADH:ubiquinone oxidoreductase subunit C